MNIVLHWMVHMDGVLDGCCMATVSKKGCDDGRVVKGGILSEMLHPFRVLGLGLPL